MDWVVSLLMMPIDSVMPLGTPICILGYPALAMVMLMMAGAGANYLAIKIVRHDRTPKTR